MLFENLFQFFGQIIIVIAISLFILLIVALILGRILLEKNILIFPKLVVFALDFLYSPLKQLSKRLGFDEIMVDHMGVEIRNKVNAKKFKEIANEKKIIVFPHCLRHPSCEANLDETGLVCSHCKKCAIGVIKPKAENMGYRIFIIPGSTFMKKIIKNHKFESVIGIACYSDLNMAMMNLSKFTPQGVLLSRTGCFKTKVDIKTVLEKIGYFDVNPKSKHLNDSTNEIRSTCTKENMHK
jgi:hypothetical protein